MTEEELLELLDEKVTSYCEWEFYKQARNYNTEENGGIIIVFNTIKESNNDT